MTSTNSFFDLLRENFRRRIWSAALCTLLFFFLFPVLELLQVSHYLDSSRWGDMDPVLYARARDQVVRNFKGWVETDDIALSFLFVCLAVVIGVSAFSWLHDARRTDFYHSLPVSRTRLFFTAHLNSLLIVGVPYLVMSLIAAVIVRTAAGGAGCFSAALLGFCGHMAFFLLAYMTTVLAMMLTGNTVVGILGTGTFFTYGTGLVALFFALKNAYYVTFYHSDAMLFPLLQRSSAFTWMINFENGPVAAVRALAALGGAAALMVLNLFLYRIRPSEAAGRAMVFPRSEFPIKLLIMVPVSLTFALFFDQMMEHFLWGLFGLVASLLICGCVMEIIFRFDFRQLFRHRLHLLIGLLLSLGIFCFFRFDLTGYDRFLPDLSQVESAGVVSDGLDDIYSYNRGAVLEEDPFSDRQYLTTTAFTDPYDTFASRMKIKDLDNVYSIASTAVSLLSAKEDNASPEEYRRACTILIAWHMKNGRTVLRRYTPDPTKIRAELDRVYDDPDYKKAIYSVLGLDPAELAGANYRDIDTMDHVTYSDPETGIALLTAYQEELLALTASDRRRSMPVATIQFKSRDFQHMADVAREHDLYLGPLNDVGYFPVYPSFVRTLKILEQCGVELNRGLQPDRVASLVISDNRSFPGLTYEENEARHKSPLLLDDRAKIAEVLDAAVITDLNCVNELGPVYNGLTVSVRRFPAENTAEAQGEGFWYDAGGEVDYYAYNLYFDKNKIPGFVTEYFGIDESDRSYNSNSTY